MNELLEKRLIKMLPGEKGYELTNIGQALSEQIKSNLIEEKQRSSSRYYVYLSDSKVEMLFSQISGRSDDNLYKKADEVIKHIHESKKVGTIEAPGEYFEGTVEMKWGPFNSARMYFRDSLEPLAYFSGHFNQTLVALCGSTKHLIGVDIGELGKSDIHSYSLAPMIQGYLLSKLDLPVPKEVQGWELHSNENENETSNLIRTASASMSGPPAKLEFMARTLMQWPRSGCPEIVLGTPIYVALAGETGAA